MVAVMVTLIMMIVISLIVIGFAQVTRRAQRNALDAQLSGQAFYAAESGVNDASAIMKVLAASGPILPKTTCDDTAVYNFNSTGKSKIDGAASGVSYTCVLIDPTPSSLDFKLGQTSSQVTKLKTASGLPFTSLTFKWVPGTSASSSVASCPSGAGQYPINTAAAWNCKFAALRSELTPAAGALTRNGAGGLIETTHVNFLEPVRPPVGTGASVWATDNAKSIGALCTDAQCQVTINFAGAGVNTYYLRLGAIYQSASVTITATDAAGPAKFAESQAQVSVTGKAQDVLRRILVAIPLDGDALASPTSAIVSGDTVCKRFLVTNGYFSTEGFSGSPNNPVCGDTVEVGTPSP